MRAALNLKVMALIFATALVLRWAGVDLWAFAARHLTSFRDDSKAMASGEYKERIANSLRKETEKQPLAVVSGNEDLQRELAAARKQMLDDRAAALEKHTGEILRGDVNTLKRQVTENARAAGGSN